MAKIHTVGSTPAQFFVNSFIIEGADSLVLVDTQFLMSSARALADRITALAKPLEAVIITHPHPDHFNGLPVILERFGPAPVYANHPTLHGIKATQADKRAAWTPVYGDDYPPHDALPDQLLSADPTITLAGVEFRVVDLGPGESSDITVIHVPAADALIASDLVYNRCHPWLAEHRSVQWLEQLDRVAAEFAGVGRVLAGHGPAGGPNLFGEQRRYIEDFRAAVRDRLRDGPLDDAARASIIAETTEGRDGWPLEMLIGMNLAAVAEEYAGSHA